jgi:exosome complex component RRP42
MSTTPHEMTIINLEKDDIFELAKKGKRIDGRNLMDHRKLEINIKMIEKANGSAQVLLGNTQVIAGVKVEVGTPFPDTPDQGVLTVNAELTPIASPTFEGGPPGEEAIELARIVDRSIRESKMVDLEKLCITSGKKVFIVFVDINVIDHDGNLIDASTIASVSALLCSKIQEYELIDDELIYKSKEKPLPITNCPLSITFAKLREYLVIDPCYKEEAVMSSRLTVGVNEKGQISALQKGGNGELTIDEVKKATSAAIEKSKDLRSRILEAVKNSKN